MSFDGVFAFQGKNHITASQLGRLVQGTAGDGRYVLPTQDLLQATMQTANKVVIGSGDLVMDGRYVTNETGAELTVESGTSGYNRNDIVALRYSKDGSTGVESFEPVVIKGAPVTGTAADPAVDAGAISDGSSEALMPLWRIPIRGLAPGTPERIATVGKTLSEIRDSVSRVLARPGITLSGTVTVPGLKNRAAVTVAFRHGAHGVMPTSDGTHAVGGAVAVDGYSVVTASTTATVSGEQVTFKNAIFGVFRTSGLGSALTLGAGDAETIDAIYG